MYVNQSERVGGKEKETNEEKDKSREVELEIKQRNGNRKKMSFYIQWFVLTVSAAVLSKLIIFLVLRKYIKKFMRCGQRSL